MLAFITTHPTQIALLVAMVSTYIAGNVSDQRTRSGASKIAMLAIAFVAFRIYM